MLDRLPSDAKRKLRRDRYRRRQANGMVVLDVEVHEHDFAKALTRSGRLTPDQALLRSEIERALALIVADFIERWRGRVPCDDN